MKTTSFLTSLVLAGLALNANAATLLSIDFGTGNANSPVQSGFTEQTAASALHSTAAGNITVATTGARFSRGYTGGPAPDLFTDFTFLNSLGTMTLTLSGAGIAANTAYEILFYSFDSQHGTGGGTVTYAGTSGTVGSTSIAYSTNFINNNSSLSTWTSNGSGQIVIDVTGTNEGPRVNGFEIIPEPSTALLGGLGMLVLLRRRR